MSIHKPDTRLRNLYNQYLYLDDKAYYDKVRFYEQNESDVFNMRLEDSLWIQSGYLSALFQIGEYRKFNDKAQRLLQRLIYHNISYFQEEDLYEETLHKMACAKYQLKDYDESMRISKELLKINPERKDTKRVLFCAIRSDHQKSLKFIRAAIIASLLGAAFLLLFEQIVIFSFFPHLVDWFMGLIAQIFIPLFTVLILFKIGIDLRSNMKATKWKKLCIERKKSTSK